MGELPQLLDALPRQYLRQGVCSGDEEQFSTRVGPAKVAKGVGGVRRSVSIDIHPADGESRIGGSGNHGHEIAVFSRANRVSVLPIRLAGGDEDHFVEIEQ